MTLQIKKNHIRKNKNYWNKLLLLGRELLNMARFLKHKNIQHSFIYNSKILQEPTFPQKRRWVNKFYIIKYFETIKIILYINIACYGKNLIN